MHHFDCQQISVLSTLHLYILHMNEHMYICMYINVYIYTEILKCICIDASMSVSICMCAILDMQYEIMNQECTYSCMYQNAHRRTAHSRARTHTISCIQYTITHRNYISIKKISTGMHQYTQLRHSGSQSSLHQCRLAERWTEENYDRYIQIELLTGQQCRSTQSQKFSADRQVTAKWSTTSVLSQFAIFTSHLGSCRILHWQYVCLLPASSQKFLEASDWKPNNFRKSFTELSKVTSQFSSGVSTDWHNSTSHWAGAGYWFCMILNQWLNELSGPQYWALNEMKSVSSSVQRNAKGWKKLTWSWFYPESKFLIQSAVISVCVA